MKLAKLILIKKFDHNIEINYFMTQMEELIYLIRISIESDKNLSVLIVLALILMYRDLIDTFRKVIKN